MRIRLVLLGFVIAVVGIVSAVSGVVAPSADALAAPGANIAHPYSQPLWSPLRSQSFRLDCAGSSTNNNSPTHCDRDHVGYYAINFVVPLYAVPPSPGNPGVRANPHPNIYAAGAGVVSKVVSGQTCNHGSGVLPGNEVYVNHGGGIVSVYQHMHAVSVSVGEYITAKTVLGTVGATGAGCINGVEGGGYLDFQIRHWGGSAALTLDTPTLLACANGKGVAWPKALPLSRYQYVIPRTAPQTWTQVPFGAGIYVNPSTDFTCVPGSGGTGSPNPIASARVTTVNSSTHTLSWPAVPTATAYTVELQQLKGSTWSVPCSPFVTKGCTYGFYLFSATSAPHFTISGSASYRVRVYARNGVGFSKVSGWYSA